MAPSTEDRIRQYADNALLLLISRLAMMATPLIAGLLVYLGGFYLEARFDSAKSSITDLDQRVRAVQDQSNKAVLAITDLNKQNALTNQTVSVNGVNVLAWQVTTSARLDKMTDVLVSLSNSVAGLTATVQAMNK